MTLAVVFAAWREISPELVAIALAVLSLICALGVSIDAGTGYYRYRKSINNAKSKDDAVNKEEEDKIEVPAHDEKEIINEIDPATIPVEEPTQESNIVS